MTEIDASTIIGADKFLEGLNRPLEDINKNIADLENEIAALQVEANKVKDPFSVQGLNEAREIQAKIDLYATGKAKAELQREKITKSHYAQNFEEARKIVSDHQTRLYQEFKPKNDEIRQKVQEIRALYAEIKNAQKSSKAALSSFAHSVAPFLNPDEEGMSRSQANILVYEAGAELLYNGAVGDKEFGTTGLKPDYYGK